MTTAEKIAKLEAELEALRIIEEDEKIAAGFRKVRNAMTGAEVWEKADTPFSCSVASESYWCS